MKSTELHLAPDRRHRYARLEPKIWLESSLLRTWVVAEPSVIVHLLRDPRTVILSVAEMMDAIEHAHGIAFPNVRYAANHLPLFLEGNGHAEQRRRFSRYLAGRVPDLERVLPDLMERHLGAFKNRGTVDLLSDVMEPLVHDINELLVGQDLPAEIGALYLLDLFALNKSVSRFKDLDTRTARALQCLRTRDSDETSVADRFTALVMGFETLMTMLVEGLVSAFSAASEDTGDRATLPAHPVETGVPISYRRVNADIELSGLEFKAGDLLRLQLQTLGYVPRAVDRTWIFGAGVHSCVGKQVSLRIWSELRRAFDAMLLKGRLRSYELVPSHYLVRHKSVVVEVLQ